jgi:cell division protein FtsB
MSDFDFAVFNSYLNNRETNVFARFHDVMVKTGEFNKNGMPEFKSVVYVEIKVKDSRDVVDRPAREDDIRRFPREYQFYEVKKDKVKSGTPLNQFAFLSPIQIESCNVKGIFTVEDLASLDEERARNIGLLDEVAFAKKFLEMSKNNNAIAKYEAEIKKLKAEIVKLKDELKAVREQ